MSDTSPTDSTSRSFQSREVPIKQNVLSAARLPFLISIISLLSLLVLIFVPFILSAMFRDRSFDLVPFLIPPEAGLWPKFLSGYAIHFLLAVITLVGVIVGYKIAAASGANPTQVIPPQDYELLAPLVSEGKADSIEQYVRLSSLSGFTGTFTQLGLTGLPLATIFLTLLFAALTLWDAQNFLDLTKLTLGAFIGSFVQRQVERRTDSTDVQSKTPASAA
jgi:hypothetical protein